MRKIKYFSHFFFFFYFFDLVGQWYQSRTCVTRCPGPGAGRGAPGQVNNLHHYNPHPTVRTILSTAHHTSTSIPVTHDPSISFHHSPSIHHHHHHPHTHYLPSHYPFPSPSLSHPHPSCSLSSPVSLTHTQTGPRQMRFAPRQWQCLDIDGMSVFLRWMIYFCCHILLLATALVNVINFIFIHNKHFMIIVIYW